MQEFRFYNQLKETNMKVHRCVGVALVALISLICSPKASAEAFAFKIADHRHTFYRGEVLALNVTCSNSSSNVVENAALTVSLGDGVAVEAPVKSLAAGASVQKVLQVPTVGVHTGAYPLSIRLVSGGTTLASASDSIVIGKKPNPERLNVWLWAHGGPCESFYQEHGFTCAGGPLFPYGGDLKAGLADARKRVEAVLPSGMDVSIIPVGGLWHREFSLLKPEGPDIEYKGAARHGEEYYNPFSPAVARAQDEANRQFMEAMKDLPHVKFGFIDGEYVDNLYGDNRNEGGIEQTKKTLGFMRDEIGQPKFVAPGVLADDDRGYLFHKYVYQRGNGLALAHQRTVNMVQRYRPDIPVIVDPYRSAALLDMFPGVGILQTWTYTNPDPKLMLYIETLRAACRPANQIPLQVVTLLNYPGELAPTKEWMLMGPGRTKVTTWINLSRAPKIIGYYYSSACNPVPQTNDEFRVPHATSDALKELSDKVFKPYGPMLTNLEIEPRKIAVLSSEASRLHGKSPGLAGYPNYQIYHFYTVLAMAHLQADVVFDETVERYGLDGYNVLVLPKCDVLTKKVYDEVLKFQRRGGLVIADQYLGPDIPGAIRFDFDFTYRRKVNANAIAQNKMFADAGQDDHLDPKTAAMKQVAGVTALDDQRIMESYAARLKKELAGKIDPDVDCDEPTVLFNMLEKDGTKYLVLVNDKRTYDDRIGKYKAMLGKIEPQTVTVRLNKWKGKELYAYDMLEKKILKVEQAGDVFQFPVSLSDLGGTIVALYARPVSRLVLDAPKRVQAGTPGRIKIRLATSGWWRSLTGLQPVQITMTDPQGRVSEEYGDYYCAKNGRLEWTFIPALNDMCGAWTIHATDLTAGLVAEARVEVVARP